MEHVTSLDGTVIGYRRSGSGKPLLLVHGATANHQRWAATSPSFEKHFTVYALDRRGRGGSGDSPSYHILREAEDVAAVVEAAYQQTGEPVSVIGHSYGGLCCLEAALLTGKISSLILYEPPMPIGLPMYSLDFPGQMHALVEKGELEAALELLMREEVKIPEHELAVYRRLPMWKESIKIVSTVLREMVIDQVYHFSKERFASLQTPTLLLLGGDSPSIYQQQTERIHAALPNSKITILPGERHIAMDTNPELFVSVVLGYLQAA